MATNTDKIVRIDARNFPRFGSDDLDYFQRILTDIVGDYEGRGALSVNDREYLKVQLAAALFKRAEDGERDYARLRQSAIEAVSAVPSSDPDP